MGTEVIDNIQSIIVSQFKESDVIDYLEALTLPIQDVRDVLTYMLSHCAIDTAEGVWLDLWGKLVGLPRPFASYEPTQIFRFRAQDEIDTGDTDNAFLSSSGINGGVWERSTGGPATPRMLIDDIEYRRLIESKLAMFSSGSSRKDIWQYIFNSFGVDANIVHLGDRYNEYNLSPDNLVINGEFATDLSGWTIVATGDSTVTYSSTGGGSMRLGKISSGAAYADQAVTIDPGRHTIFIGIYSTISTGHTITVSTAQGGGTTLVTQAVPGGLSNASYLLHFDVPEGTDAVWVRVIRNVIGTSYIMRIAIYPYFSKSEIEYLQSTAPVAAGSNLEMTFSPDYTNT